MTAQTAAPHAAPAAAAVAAPWAAVSAPASAAYTDARPGSIPVRPLAMGEILDGAMVLLRTYPGPTFGLGAIVAGIQMVLTVPIQWLTQNLTFSLSEATDGDGVLSALLAVSLSTVLVFIVATACGGVVTSLMAPVVGNAALGRPVTVATVWREVRPRLWAVIGLSLLIGLATGVCMLVVPLVGWFFALIVFAVAIPALVLERVGVWAAIRRSWNLTIRDFFRVLGVRLLCWLVAYVLSIVVSLPLLAVGEYVLVSGGGEPSPERILVAVFLVGLGTMAGTVLAAPFAGCAAGLLYLDRRMRGEGLDIELGHRARMAAADRLAAAAPRDGV